LDQGIGRILETLKDLNIEEETVVIFLSDNGSTHEDVSSKEIIGGPIGSRHSFTSYTRSWANVSNTPFKMYKHWVHEGRYFQSFDHSLSKINPETANQS